MPTWDNLDILTSAFTQANMLIPYKGGISKQFLRKLANNTGFNFSGGPPVIINNAGFTAQDEIQVFDAARDYRNVVVALFYSTNEGTSLGDLSAAGTWHFDPDQAGGTPGLIHNISFQKVTTTFITLAHTPPAVPVIDIDAESAGAGFRLKLTSDPSPNTQYIAGLLFRINSSLVDAGT